MINAINGVFSGKAGLKLMTHVVAGYPDPASSRAGVEEMAAGGADLIEIQIPFSDPLADGSTIMRANHRALENGIRPEDCFAMVKSLKMRVPVPLILMTYANIPFRMGWKTFADKAAESGADGAIIPDLPFDEGDGRRAWDLLTRRGIHPLPVLSPGIADDRLRAILDRVSGFLYLTLRTGTTGAVPRIDPAGLEFLARVRRRTPLPIVAGFGLSSAEQVAALGDHVEGAVIGSRVIEVFDQTGWAGVRRFLEDCREAIRTRTPAGPKIPA